MPHFLRNSAPNPPAGVRPTGNPQRVLASCRASPRMERWALVRQWRQQSSNERSLTSSLPTEDVSFTRTPAKGIITHGREVGICPLEDRPLLEGGVDLSHCGVWQHQWRGRGARRVLKVVWWWNRIRRRWNGGAGHSWRCRKTRWR